MGTSKYQILLAVFGGGDKPAIESNRYPIRGRRISHLKIAIGDAMLLYCARSYPKCVFQKTVPGVGLVTGVETEGEMEIVNYELSYLNNPLPLDCLRKKVREIKLHEPFYRRVNWLYEVSPRSFRDAITEC